MLYVDFGSQEIVEKTRIRLLAQQFGNKPIQALHCCLYEHDEVFCCQKINELFVQLVDNCCLKAIFNGFRSQKVIV